MKIRRVIALAAVLMASSVLIWSAIGKLEDPYRFIQIVDDHGLVPEAMSHFAAWGVIIMECAVSVAALWWTLASDRVRRAIWTLAGVFGVFAIYSMLLVYMPPPEPTSCGCSGAANAGTPADWRFLTLRNSASAAMLGLLACVAPRGGRAEFGEIGHFGRCHSSSPSS